MIKFNKLILFFLIILFTGDVSFGQDTLKSKENKFLITTKPILFLGGDFITYSMCLPLGIEFKINKQFSFYQDFSYITKAIEGTSSMLILQKNITKIKGIRSDSEIKRYINKKNNLTGFYLSTHLLYQYTDAFSIDNGGEYQTTYRNLFAIHEKIGWQIVSIYGFVFDVAIGFGTRYEYSKTTYTNQLHVFNESVSTLYPYSKIYQYGSKWFFSVNTTFKIGWAF